MKRLSTIDKLVIAAAVALATLWAGSKPGRVSVDDYYIRDAGSYLTNDVVHIAVAKSVLLLPDSTEILVYARPYDSTNVADWVRLEPYLTFADHPHDYALFQATNYNVLVAARYEPAPTVHTNGVWQIRGFEIPGMPGALAFPNTRTTLKGDE